MLTNKNFLGEFLEQTQAYKYTIKREYIDSKLDKVRLYHTKFTPDEPKYTIAIIHGFGQHSGRFRQIAHFFALQNFEVLLIDMTGFGYSGGPRGCATVQILQNDVITLLTQANPDIPLFIYAHSMGGLVTVKLLLQREQLKISGCILTSPLLIKPKDRKISFMKEFIVKQIGDQLQDMIVNSMVNPTALTKNNNFMHNIFEDRLMIPFLSVKMAKSLFTSIEWVQEHMHRFKVPVIVFHGKKDSVVDYEGSKKFVFGKVDIYKQLHLFENGYHQLQHDLQKDQLLERGLKFLISLPAYKIANPGNIVYSELEIPLKKKKSSLLLGAKVLAIIAIIVFIIRRFKKH